MRRTLRCVLAAAVAMTLLGACGDDDDEAASSEPTELKVTVTEVGDQVKLDLPTTIEGGVVNLTFTNSGQGVHSLQFVKVADGHTVADVIAFIPTTGAPVPDWISEGGGIGTVAPGQTGTATFELSDGRHIVWDDETGGPDDKNNGTRGGIAQLDVEGDGEGDLPDAVGTISAKEYEFTVQNLKPGKTTVRFENTGKEFHHFIAGPITADNTLDDVKAYFAAEGQSRSSAPRLREGCRVAGDGTGPRWCRPHPPAGNYAMVCFINDRAGGPPHFTLGMIQQVHCRSRLLAAQLWMARGPAGSSRVRRDAKGMLTWGIPIA